MIVRGSFYYCASHCERHQKKKKKVFEGGRPPLHNSAPALLLDAFKLILHVLHYGRLDPHRWFASGYTDPILALVKDTLSQVARRRVVSTKRSDSEVDSIVLVKDLRSFA